VVFESISVRTAELGLRFWSSMTIPMRETCAGAHRHGMCVTRHGVDAPSRLRNRQRPNDLPDPTMPVMDGLAFRACSDPIRACPDPVVVVTASALSLPPEVRG
jgi:hypothetical protein